MFDYLVAHGRMKEKEARVKFRQVHMYISSMTKMSHLTLLKSSYTHIRFFAHEMVAIPNMVPVLLC